jgi:hypothetical protein
MEKGFTKIGEKFNFSGELPSSDFEIIELGTDPAGFRKVSVVLGNDEIGRVVINASMGGYPFKDKLINVNVGVKYDGGNAQPGEMMGKCGCIMNVSNVEGGPDQSFVLYVDEDLDKLKKIFGI